jgi:hypothetical protein
LYWRIDVHDAAAAADDEDDDKELFFIFAENEGKN